MKPNVVTVLAAIVLVSAATAFAGPGGKHGSSNRVTEESGAHTPQLNPGATFQRNVRSGNPSSFAFVYGHNDTEYLHVAGTSSQPGLGPIRPGNGVGAGHCHGSRCRWIPGHYECRQELVWVPGRWYQQYYPARYDYRIVNGLRIVELVQAEHYKSVWIPGYYDTYTWRVWVPGFWTCGYG